jgi:hypothetical protein
MPVELDSGGRAITASFLTAKAWLHEMRSQAAIRDVKPIVVKVEGNAKGKQREVDSPTGNKATPAPPTPIATDRPTPRRVTATESLPASTARNREKREVEEVEVVRSGDEDEGDAETEEEEIEEVEEGDVEDEDEEEVDGSPRKRFLAGATPTKSTKIAEKDKKTYKLGGQYQGKGATRKKYRVWINVSRAVLSFLSLPSADSICRESSQSVPPPVSGASRSASPAGGSATSNAGSATGMARSARHR